MPLLRQLRHPLWSPQAPKGFGDTTQEWADPDSLLNRAELARTVARRLRARQIDPRTAARCRRRPRGRSAERAARRQLDLRRRARRARAGGTRFPVEMTMDRRTFVRNMCLGGIATFGLPVVNFAQVKQQRTIRVRAAARRVRRAGRRRAVRRSGVPRAARHVRVRRVRARRAERDVRPGAWAGAAARLSGSSDELVVHPRHGDPVSHAKPLRRPGDSRDGHRSAGRVVGRLAESPAAGDDRRAVRASPSPRGCRGR